MKIVLLPLKTDNLLSGAEIVNMGNSVFHHAKIVTAYFMTNGTTVVGSALTEKGRMTMPDKEKVINGLEHCDFGVSDTCYEKECPYYQSHDCTDELKNDILVLLKEQEPVKPIVNEYGEAFCVCGENVGIIPNSKSLPKIRSKYCSECGRRMKWE